MRSEAEECLCFLSQLASLERFPEMGYFYELGLRYYDPQAIAENPPHVVILGGAFPFEFLPKWRDMRILWVTGGGHDAAQAADALVPRDTDPVSRSMLGYILQTEESLKKSLILVPLYSDAQRKMAAILTERGLRVAAFDLPADKTGPAVVQMLEQELTQLWRKLALHMKKRVTGAAVEARLSQMREIREAVVALRRLERKKEAVFPELALTYVLHTFYLAPDWDEWLRQLKLLTSRLRHTKCEGRMQGPKVMTAGSPLYFPNYKIPRLLWQAGIRYAGNVDLSAFRPYSGEIRTAGGWLMQDCSPAGVQNDTLLGTIRLAASETQADGLIWHILKGQIEYDYELERFEQREENALLPVLRVETDYQQQDVEQLRIRMEAFGELLSRSGASEYPVRSGSGEKTAKKKKYGGRKRNAGTKEVTGDGRPVVRNKKYI